jgi:uncharacterized protein (DUF2147 family)
MGALGSSYYIGMLKLLTLVMVFGCLCPLAGKTPPPITGIYATKGGKAHVEVRVAADGTLEAVGARGGLAAEFNDDKNPDEKLRGRSLLGEKIFWGFRPSNAAKTKWSGGKIYDPDDGKTYSARVIQKGNQLHIRGFIGTPVLGSTVIWQRVE